MAKPRRSTRAAFEARQQGEAFPLPLFRGKGKVFLKALGPDTRR